LVPSRIHQNVVVPGRAIHFGWTWDFLSEE
jgi:hypothetical protein